MPPEVCQIQHGQYSQQGRGSDVWALGSLEFVLEKESPCFFQVFFSLK